MVQIDNYFLTRRTIENFAYRLLRQIAKAALVSMTFFSAVSGSSGAVSTGDGLPLGCCQFFEADANPFAAVASSSRSIASTGRSSWKSPAPIMTIVAQPSSFQWQFDYPAPDALQHRETKAANFWTLKGNGYICFHQHGSQFESMWNLEQLLEFQISAETRAQLSLLTEAVALEARTAISACLLRRSPVPTRVIRLVRQAIPESL